VAAAVVVGEVGFVGAVAPTLLVATSATRVIAMNNVEFDGRTSSGLINEANEPETHDCGRYHDP